MPYIGFNQAALDTAAHTGFGYAAFEFSDEEIPEVMDEFFAKDQGEPDNTPEDITPTNSDSRSKAGLREKLERKAHGQHPSPV